VTEGINTRDGAQVLVGSSKPLYSTDSGYAVAPDNDFGSGNSNEILAGTLKTVPYPYTKIALSKVNAAIFGTA